MEQINVLHLQRKNPQSSSRNISKNGPSKDLWVVVREGSVFEVESALVVLKKYGGDINSRNAFGLTPLHIATWRNHAPIVKRLLEAGADPNARDRESGWTSLHRALHFGHLAVASILLKSDAFIAIEDLSHEHLWISYLDLCYKRMANGIIQRVNLVIRLLILKQLHGGFSLGDATRKANLDMALQTQGQNYTPRVVEYLKGKVFVGVAAAKFHTVVLGIDGEVFTWGHRLVTPRRVVVARIIKKSGSTPLKFHRSERLHVVAIAAGMTHTSVLTDDGALFYWVSSEPNLRCQQLYSVCEKSMVSISARKYRTAGVTACGDVYMWDGKKRKDEPPLVTKLHGVKRATLVSVRETHLLVISSLYHPSYSLETVYNHQDLQSNLTGELDEDFTFNDNASDEVSLSIHKENVESKSVPSLKSLCEKVAAERLLEPRSVLQLLEVADSLEAHDLRKHCEDIVIRNLDYILTVCKHAVSSASFDILANLERSLDSKSSESWSHRRVPTITASFPAIIDSEEEDTNCEFFWTHSNHYGKLISTKDIINQKFDSFFRPYCDANQDIVQQVQAIQKKLQQIEMLEVKQSKGYLLDSQQITKLESRPVLESSLVELGVPLEMIQVKSTSLLTGGKGNKTEGSKKHKKKSKQKSARGDEVSNNCQSETKVNSVKSYTSSEVDLKEKVIEGDRKQVSIAITESPIELKKDVSCTSESKNLSSPASSKRKSRKGGLSMFLSGALDDTPKKDPLPPLTPKSEGPAWGGTTISKGSTSLREIQDEQGKTVCNKVAPRKKDQVEVLPDGDRYTLSLFFPSKPIRVASTLTCQMPDVERYAPPWVSSGTSPVGSHPSLRGIQLQQGKKQQTLSHSPKTRTTGCAPTSGQGSPSDSMTLSRWFKPEVEAPSSLRSIQIEEMAMKDLKRLYSSVKIVKKES